MARVGAVVQRPHLSFISETLSLSMVIESTRGNAVQPVPMTATKGFVAYPAPFSAIATEKLLSFTFFVTVAVA